MKNCKNCGHEQHCGKPLVKKIAKENEKPIGVCERCRCDDCRGQ